MKKVIKQKIRIKELIEFIIGCFLVALAFNLFMSPNNLVAGGVSGFSLILKHFFGLNPSTIISVANVFLIILSFLVLGKEKTKATILGSILFPIFVSLTEHLSTYISFKESEMILIAVFGGVLQGLGAGLIFRAGYSTGGTDILNMIVSKIFKISLGNSMFFTDGTIILIGAFVFGFNHLMYSLIILYLISTKNDYIRRLTTNGVNQMPCFSSDGDSIMFVKHLPNQSALGIIRLNYNKTFLFPLKGVQVQAFDW